MKKISVSVMALLLCLLLAYPVSAGILSTISGTAQIQPMGDGSGKYMLKSSGFYCLDENGALSNQPEIHLFDHYEIDGTVFHGYYYHDADGTFRAGSPQLVSIKNLLAAKKQKGVLGAFSQNVEIEEKQAFDGWFQIGNLGKMGGAPKVQYLDNVNIDNVLLNGYYYFNENGRLIREPDVHFLQMSSKEKRFDGYYYFGGANGALVTENCFTQDGFPVDADGKLVLEAKGGMEALASGLKAMLEAYEGNWSVYVKNLFTDEELILFEQPMGSASVIKLFVMAATFENMDRVMANQAALMNLSPDDPVVKVKVNDLLWNMITVSDNESYNELVRLHNANHDFIYGARYLNLYLEKEGYKDTQVLHTLHPSASNGEGIGELNITSARDCGILLEKIYRGECVSSEASAEMMNLLLNQTVNWKIRAGLPSEVRCANKSGENSDNQHDVGIVFGEQNDYIICVMSENYGNEYEAFDKIRDISRSVYAYTNRYYEAESDENSR